MPSQRAKSFKQIRAATAFRAALEAMERRVLMSAGDLDFSFSGDGKNVIDLPGTTNEIANATTVLSDGKVILAGRATVGAETDFFVARLLADGNIDTTFGGGDGVALIDFSVNDEAMDVTLDENSKIVVVGTSSSGAGSNARNFAIARLSSFGILDTNFSGDGKTTVDFGTNDDAQSVAIDGSLIYVGGYKDLGATAQFALARLLSTGAEDTTYSGDGEVFFGFGGNNDSRCFDIAIDSSSRVAMVGYDENFASPGTGRNFAYARVGTNAILDPGFSGDGLAVTDFASADDEARAVGIGIDGRITVGGFSPGTGGNDFTATRLSDAGALDSTFNGDGAFRLNLGGVEAVDDLVVHPDGDITLSGQTSVGSFQAALVRIRALDGQLSTTFGDGGDGIQLINLGVIDDGFAVALDPRDLRTVVAGTDGSGKLAVARVHDLIDQNFAPLPVQRRRFVGYEGHRIIALANQQLERLLSDGSLDTSFSGDGIFPLPASEFAYDVAIDSQNRIVVLTTFQTASTNDAKVRRLLPSGILDPSFSGDGAMTFRFSVAEDFDQYYSLAIDSQDRIVIGGGQDQSVGSASHFALARVTTTGLLDTTFDGDGIASYDLSAGATAGVIDYIERVLIQPDGRIIGVGQAEGAGFDLDVAILRVNTNGSKDNSFGLLGEVRQDVNNRDDIGSDATLDSSGRIVVGGHCFDSLNPNNPGDGFIARFETDGDLDMTFSGDGLILFSSEFEQDIFDVSVEADGRILATGDIVVPGHGRLAVIRRFLANTQPDTSFAGDGIWIGPDDAGLTNVIDGAIYFSSGTKFKRLNIEPSITDFDFLFETGPQRMQVSFNDDVGDSLANADLFIRNVTASATVFAYAVQPFDSLSNTSTVNFNSILADGNYTVTLSDTGVENRQGMNLTGDRVNEFFFLNADGNRDRVVNALDFNALATNFGGSGKTFSQGNYNYDSAVNTLDFNLLATQFGKRLAPLAPGPSIAEAFAALSRAPADLFGGKQIANDESDNDGMLI